MGLRKRLAFATFLAIGAASIGAAWSPTCDVNMTSDADDAMAAMGMMAMSDAPPADAPEQPTPDRSDCPFGPIGAGATCVSAAVVASSGMHDFGVLLGTAAGPAFTATLQLDLLASNLFHPPKA